MVYKTKFNYRNTNYGLDLKYDMTRQKQYWVHVYKIAV